MGKSKAPEPTGITVTDSLSDLEEIVIGGTTVTVFAIPGHTLGSAAYLWHGGLVLGDSAAATSAGTLGGAPPVFSADRDQARQSLIRLARQIESSDNYRVDTLAFGHQGPLQGLKPLQDWANANRD